MHMQDNKAAYATLTVAVYNWAIKHYYTSRTHYKNSSGDEIANVNFYAYSAPGRYPNSLK